MERTRIKRHRWRAGIGIVLLAVGAVGIGLVWPRERLLIEIARPITPLDTRKDQVCWRSDHQLFLLLGTPGEPASESFPDRKKWKGSASLLDIATGVRTDLPELTRLLNAKRELPILRPDSFASPDGTWFLWGSGGYIDMDPFPRMAHLDGTHYYAWSHSGHEKDFFLDARHFVQMMGDEPLMTVHDLQDPAQDREYPNPDQAKVVLDQQAMHQPVSITVQNHAFSHPDRRRYAAIEAYRTQDSLQRLLALSMPRQKAPQPIRTYECELPHGATYRNAVVSPSQQSIVYHLQITRVPSLLSWLHRIRPSFQVKPTFLEALWISRADGRGMHEIGHITTKLDDSGAPEDLMEAIQWLPNGKQISFVYHGTLYVVPAEPEQ